MSIVNNDVWRVNQVLFLLTADTFQSMTCVGIDDDDRSAVL